MEEKSDFVPNECGRSVDDGVDRISQLPDEILLVILSCVSLREAATTSVLSSRWTDLWKHTPYLDLDYSSLSPHYFPKSGDESDDDTSEEAKRCKHIETITSVFQLHKALSLKRINIILEVKKSDKCAVTNWLKFVLSRQVESLVLLFFCDRADKFVLGELLRESRIRLLPQTDLIFFQSLKRLFLGCLKVSGEDIELFLRNCPLLEQLIIHRVTLTSDVELCGANLMLQHLDIYFCTSENSIKVSAPNLTWIKFSDYAGTLLFENVPKLVEAEFKLKGSLFSIQHFSSAASCYISQLQSLKLELCNLKVFWMSGFPKMPNLKKLDIRIRKAYTHSLLPLTALIWASPRLEEIKIKFLDEHELIDPSAWMGAITNVERSRHQHLKVFAFQMWFWEDVGIRDRIIELVTYILHNCAALQKIIIGSPRGVTAEMQAGADDLMQQLQSEVPNHIQLELTSSI